MRLRSVALRHVALLFVGPIIVMIASLLGADTFDGFTHETSDFSTLLELGFFLTVAIPVCVVIRGILLTLHYHKKNKKWILLPVATLILSLALFPATLYLSHAASEYSDCRLAKEDNPYKCGF